MGGGSLVSRPMCHRPTAGGQGAHANPGQVIGARMGGESPTLDGEY